MSSYIVSPKTVNRIITFLLNPGPYYSTEYLQDPISKLCFYLSSREAEKHAHHLGKKMMELNLYSVQERYPNDSDLQESTSIKDYAYRYEPASPIQAFKSLRCFLYQACEGDADETDLYKALEQVSQRLAVEIVGHLPEFQRAKWG